MTSLRFLAAVLALLSNGILRAEEPAAADSAGPADLTAVRRAQREAEAAIRAKLAERIDSDFADTPLKEALVFLRDLTGLGSIRVDEKALMEVGIGDPMVA